MWIQLKLVFLLVENVFGFEGLFDALDLHMLDDIDFCQIKLESNVDTELFESSHYITFDDITLHYWTSEVIGNLDQIM